MDLFDLGRDIDNNNNNNAGNTNSKKVTIIDNDDSAIVRAMEEIQMPVLVIGVQSDLLFPVHQQKVCVCVCICVCVYVFVCVSNN